MTAKPPSRVKIGVKDFSIELSAEEINKQDSEGVCFARYERIYIAPDLAPNTQRVTVLHELLHACFDDAQVGGPFDDEKHEETACLALAPRLLDTLRRNPKLITYLVAP